MAGRDEDQAGKGSIAQEWDQRYSAQPRLFRQEPDETLVELVSPLSPGTALDLGAGEGRNSLWLAAKGWDVTAVDVSAVALDRLRQSAAAQDVVLDAVADDIFAYLQSAADRNQTFDLVVIAFVHPPPEDRVKLLAAAGDRLRPGGHLFVVAHHREALGVAGPPDPARLYAEDDLRVASDTLDVLRLERRTGLSDVTHPGVDLVLWARRPADGRPFAVR
jgi:SAM-dependent methyltransferase